MYTAIHANPMSSRPSANLHHLLHHIHSYKNHRAVSSLITDLYQPILWRSFTVSCVCFSISCGITYFMNLLQSI